MITALLRGVNTRCKQFWALFNLFTVLSIVLILDGISEVGAHVRRNLGYLICLKHLFTSRAVTNRNAIYRKDLSKLRSRDPGVVILLVCTIVCFATP